MRQAVGGTWEQVGVAMDIYYENEVTRTEDSSFYAFIPLIICVLA